MDFKEHKKYKSGVFKTKAEIELMLKEQGIDKIYYALSFGAGTQSTHILEDHFRGKINYDYIIMSDTGAEPHFIKKQVEWWQNRQREIGNTTPFLISRHSSMEHGLKEMLFKYFYTDFERFQLPIHCKTMNEDGTSTNGMMKRQCTGDYKILPAQKLFRKLVYEREGIPINKRLPKNIAMIMDIGFSGDEINRINRYQSMNYKYIYLSYPLVESNYSTQDSIDFLQKNSFPQKRSRCYLCPFNCDKDETGVTWSELINDEPFSFLKACWFDSYLRDLQATGQKRMTSIPYLHYSRTPLKEYYKTDYDKIALKYCNELCLWVNKWRNYVINKEKNSIY